MAGKTLLPLLGGAPAVWNVCLVFFQLMLLGGYLYADLLVRYCPPRRQRLLHLPLLILGIICFSTPLPQLVQTFQPEKNLPTLALILILIKGVGLPFLLLASTSSILQYWYGSGKNKDPYFLYAASNLGSFTALISYPILLEPFFGLNEQFASWRWGYFSLMALIGACAMRVKASDTFLPSNTVENPVIVKPSRVLSWILWAFIPSSLLSGVTTYLTTDIISLPLLWVIPLGIYLLSFVIVFSSQDALEIAGGPLLSRLLALGATIGLIGAVLESNHPVWIFFPAHLVVFFLVCILFHGKLASDRPPPEKLSQFYLWISVGGVLGGIFNALLAPVLFSQVLEYPLVIILACLLRPSDFSHTGSKGNNIGKSDFLIPAGIGLLTAVLGIAARHFQFTDDRLARVVAIGVPALLCHRLVRRAFPHALGLAALLYCKRRFLSRAWSSCPVS